MDAEMKRIIRCDLCEAPAAVRCDSDAAFLCLPCDATVHGANFLVARHVRQAVCSVCHRLDHDRPFTGVWIHFHRPICSSCEFDVADSSSSSSSCISTADKRETAIIARRPRRRSCEERALARLGRRGRARENNPKASRIASDALGPRRRKMRSSPSRICAAAVARFAMKPHFPDPAKFRILEARSGVPSKHILASESHLSLALCGYHREVEEEEAEEERWGESSSSSS